MNKYIALVCFILAGCVSPKYDSYIRHAQSKTLPESAQYVVKIVPAGKIDIRGVFDPTRGLTTGSQLYAADAGIAGVAAQIFVQAALVDEMQDQKLKAQKALANKVLKPFSKIVDELSTANLRHASAQYSFATPTAGSGKTNTGKWLLVSRPIFYVAQDSYRLSIKHVIKVISTVAPRGAPVYSNRIEVLGPALPTESAIKLLRSDTELGLQQQINRLYRQSLILAIKDIQGQLTAKTGHYKTFRIGTGSMMQVERGRLISENCTQKIIQNLRGWIMAFPVQNTSAKCKAAVPAANISSTT